MTKKTKNKKSILFVMLIILIAVFYFSFFRKKEVDGPIPSDVAKEEEAAIINNNIQELENTTISDKNDFYTIEADIPRDSRDKESVMEDFIRSAVDQKKEEWKIGGKTYNETKDLEKTFQDMPKSPLGFDISYKEEESIRSGTVSYLVNQYEFSGGAHGGSVLTTFTFNDQGQVYLEEIINLEDGNDIAISKLIAEKLSGVLGENFDNNWVLTGLGLAYLDSSGNFDPKLCECDGFLYASNLQNFVVMNEGVKFIMSQYQVAPYALGMPEVVIDWTELEPYLLGNYKELAL